jgi:hypothetical protein
VSTREAVERALEWVLDGIRYYEAGNLAAARRSFTDAEILLLDADLPESLQTLAVLQSALPEEYRDYDLAALWERLRAGEAASEEGESDGAYIEREIRRIIREFGETNPRDDVIRVFVTEVEKYIQFFQHRQKEFYERAYGRKHKYWPIIREVFSGKRIPEDLGYLALVESGFNCRARSPAGALGIWQFMPGTGKRYGLVARTDFFDPVKSTDAAAEYLLDLIAIFGSPSFLLATAAYNAGENRVMRCLMNLENPFEQRHF